MNAILKMTDTELLLALAKEAKREGRQALVNMYTEQYKHIKRKLIRGQLQYIGKHYDHQQRDMELTTSLFSALRFADEANASEWMLNAMYAPKNTNDYEYVPVEITMKVKESVTNVQQKREHKESCRSVG